MKSRRGEITIIMALMFSVITVAVMMRQQMLASQKIKSLFKISDAFEGYNSNEIQLWKLYYQDKLTSLPTTVTPPPGPTHSGGGGSTSVVFLSVGKSETVTAPSSPPGFPRNICAGVGISNLCLGKKRKKFPIISWQLEAYVKPSNGSDSDQFGASLSLDTNTLAVGVMNEDANLSTISNGAFASADDSLRDSGAVYVYKRTGSSWGQEAYIKPSNVARFENFGIATSLKGDTLVAGAWQDNSNQSFITNGSTSATDNGARNSGAAFVYQRTGNTWAQQAYLKATNVRSNYYYGNPVTLQGDTIAVGSTYESSNQTTISSGNTSSSDNSSPSAGAVYVYKRTGNSWAQEAYIKAANSDGWDQFGASLSLGQDSLIVGANGEASAQTAVTNGTGASSDNSNPWSGAAYIYTRSAGVWTQQAYLKASNANVPNAWSGNLYGQSTAILDDRAAVGATGESSNQTTITNGTSSSTDRSKRNAGAVYVYKRSGANWAQEAYIKASNANDDASFGTVSMYNDILAVGAFTESSSQSTITVGNFSSSDTSRPQAGAVYIYRRTGTNWEQEAYIKASKPSAADQFGQSLQMSGDTLAVGAPFDDSNQITITPTASGDSSAFDIGAVYIFKRNTFY